MYKKNNTSNKTKKILFTSIGRRVELIQSFRLAANRLGVSIDLIEVDYQIDAPAMYFCDLIFSICLIHDDSYIDELFVIAKDNDVDLIIPTIDTDLLVLSQNKSRFEAIGTSILVSNENLIRICRDKRETAQAFLDVGLKTPKVYNDVSDYDYGYPCFIKPLDGSSSINTFKVENLKTLESLANIVDNYIIQPFIEGVEYTVDILCDFNSNPIYISPRIRLSTRGGEVMKAQIDLDKKIIDECQVLISKIKPIGPITVQLIREKSTHDDYFIEINPRFGGGVPLSIKAGADSPQFIISMLCHLEESIQINTVSNGKIYTRFDQSIECTAHASSNGVKYRAIVFDLDDTLYSECDYVRSGFNAIGAYLSNLGYDNKSSLLFDAFKRGISSPIDYVLKKNFLADDSLIATCVEVYRSHFPTINLYPRMKEILLMAKKAGIKLGIITDGRIEGQKNKIKSLFLEELIDEIVISDSLGGVHCRKPSDVSFRYIQSKLQIPFEQMLFIGDNPKKDLHAPNVLGMGTWWFKNIDGLYFNKESIDIPIRTKIIMDLESLIIELNSLLKNESTL